MNIAHHYDEHQYSNNELQTYLNKKIGKENDFKLDVKINSRLKKDQVTITELNGFPIDKDLESKIKKYCDAYFDAKELGEDPS